MSSDVQVTVAIARAGRLAVPDEGQRGQDGLLPDHAWKHCRRTIIQHRSTLRDPTTDRPAKVREDSCREEPRPLGGFYGKAIPLPNGLLLH